MSEPQEKFNLQRIYIKDLSFEAPNTPMVFKSDWQPAVNIELRTQHQLVEEFHYEVVLVVRVTVNNDQKVAYLLELQQAGLFFVSGVAADALVQVLNAYCPTILFPYARETVSDLVTKGSFPQLLLAPVNFDALLNDALRKKQMEQETGAMLQ